MKGMYFAAQLAVRSLISSLLMRLSEACCALIAAIRKACLLWTVEGFPEGKTCLSDLDDCLSLKQRCDSLHRVTCLLHLGHFLRYMLEDLILTCGKAYFYLYCGTLCQRR